MNYSDEQMHLFLNQIKKQNQSNCHVDFNSGHRLWLCTMACSMAPPAPVSPRHHLAGRRCGGEDGANVLTQHSLPRTCVCSLVVLPTAIRLLALGEQTRFTLGAGIHQ